MTGTIEKRLAELDIELPRPGVPAGNIVPYVIDDGIVYLSGHSTMWNGEPKFVGRVGGDLDLDQGKAATRICGLNLLAQLRQACGGDLDRVVRVMKVVGFVSIAPDFTEASQALNGASDLMVEVFGDKGRHARSAAGVSNLPRGSAAVVEAIVRIDG